MADAVYLSTSQHHMTFRLLTSALLLLSIAACSDAPTQNAPKPETPKALEDKSSSYDISSKRGEDDLVESLYNEQVSKNVELQQLEDKMEALQSSKSESMEAFTRFNAKNLAYFRSTDNHISAITDSSLKEKIKLLVAGKLNNYKALTAPHNELVGAIEANQMKIADLHTIVKLVETLPLMEAYQKNNLPSTKPLKEYTRQQSAVIKLADTLGKR